MSKVIKTLIPSVMNTVYVAKVNRSQINAGSNVPTLKYTLGSFNQENTVYSLFNIFLLIRQQVKKKTCMQTKVNRVEQNHFSLSFCLHLHGELELTGCSRLVCVLSCFTVFTLTTFFVLFNPQRKTRKSLCLSKKNLKMIQSIPTVSLSLWRTKPTNRHRKG